MGGCQGKSALGADDVEYSKKPKPPKLHKKQSGKQKYSKSSIHTYPIDIPVLVHDGQENSCSTQHNGNVHRDDEHQREIPAIPEPDFPSYGPDVTRSDSCDPDTPQPDDAESSRSCECESPEIDSPFVDESETRCIPPSDSGIYSLSQSSQDTTPTSVSTTQFQGQTPGPIPEEMPLHPRDTSTPTEPELCTSSTQTVGSSSLEDICDDPDRPMPATNLPVKRFLSHHGLPPQRPQSESRFSFKRLRKRKGAAGKTSITGSWKSQDSFDINSMLKTGLSRTSSACSEMCLCEELHSIQAPLAQFDSILTMDSPSCGSLNRLPHNQSVENVIDTASGQLTCSVCKGGNSSLHTSITSHLPSQRNSWSEQHGCGDESSSLTDPPERGGTDCDGVMTVCIDGQTMVALDQETYIQLLSDLALVKVKLQRIYNLLLQEEFDSISDIINSSGLETCLVDT